MPDPTQPIDPLLVTAVTGLPEVAPGDDLAALLWTALAGDLAAGDVLVVSSKVVSKARGLVERVGDGDDRDAVVVRESRRAVAARRTPRGTSRIVQAAAGPVMAAAGVDASNTAPGTVLTLPADPDAEAGALLAGLRLLGAPVVAVVVSDTAGRAWRRGQVDLALGSAGLRVVDDLRGQPDAGGQVLEVTERAVADEVASAADLVKGKASGVPAARVRGLGHLVLDPAEPSDDTDTTATALLRDPATDWFRLGHVEAVRASLGLPPDAVEPPSVLPESLRHKVDRAVDVALFGSAAARPDVLDDGAAGQVVRVTVVAGDPFAAGRLCARLQAALWAEDLDAALAHDEAAQTATLLVTPAETPHAEMRVAVHAAQPT
ncbi:hypothetical protein GCM10025868_36700 [Angustibacter aerolatus]|uniref:Coenzyme F420:L-glutamate ligase-like domain-containing protein n=1 Tax=Angustibacter aerolatus TaxID=1162965 RepID=A0ABQ6JNU7_9ACTN|nr:hypothetical protein GCM10025868_36700 [Angustibacter aerolatus]